MLFRSYQSLSSGIVPSGRKGGDERPRGGNRRAPPQNKPAQAARLPDTGQSIRYTQTFGEDADYVGTEPAFVDNGDETITDKVTGLTWQKTDGGEMTWEQAQVYAQSLRLGGHSDWRLPNSIELFGIMDHGRHGPAMNTEFFPRTQARYWWTSANRADDKSRVWVVNTGGGIGAHLKSETTSAGGDRPMHVRCVRGDSVFGSGPSLRNNGDGTLTDERTGLVWQQLGERAGMTWEEALKHCSQLNLADKSNWRLPNIKELRSLSDDHRMQPSMDRELFPNAEGKPYWSSTTQSNRPERAWYVDFSTGLVTYSDKTERYLVLAVRDEVSVAGEQNKPAPHPDSLRKTGGEKGGKPTEKPMEKRKGAIPPLNR